MPELNPTPLKSPARRRALLKGVGKGAAMAAAAGAPLAALAVNAPPKPVVTLKPSEFGPTLCSLSGWQSVQSAQMSRSLTSGGNPTCSGAANSFWAIESNWSGALAQEKGVDYTVRVIGGAPAHKRANGTAFTLLEVMGTPPNNRQPASNTVKMWVGAWLNAKAFELGLHGHVIENFPFSSQQIAQASMVGDTAMATFLAKFMQSETT